MDEHTKGPWNVRRNRSGSINGARIVSASGQHVGNVTGKADKPIAQKEADANLFAAAPDLLEALKVLTACYTQLVNSGGFWNPEEEPEVICARSALSKATGG